MTRDEILPISRSTLKETIAAAEYELTSQLWTAQKRLNGSFKSKHDQLEAAVEVGALATALQHLRKADSLIKPSPTKM